MFPHAHFCRFVICSVEMPRESISIEGNYVAIEILSRSKCNLNGLLLHWQLLPGYKAHIVMYIYAPYQAQCQLLLLCMHVFHDMAIS